MRAAFQAGVIREILRTVPRMRGLQLLLALDMCRDWMHPLDLVLVVEGVFMVESIDWIIGL